MSALEVEPDDLRVVSAALTDRAESIEAGLDRLGRQFADLFSGGWVGVAASSFDDEWADWQSGARTVIGALRDSSTALTAAADGYDTDESASATNIARADGGV